MRLVPVCLVPSLCLLLVGCGLPDPHFRDQPVTRVSVRGDVFDVRLRGRLAEAVRRNPRYAPRLGPVGPRAAQAMELVSGCRVREIRGDAAMILGLLDCGTGAPGDRRRPGPESCEVIESARLLGGEAVDLVLDCTRF